MLKSLQNDPRSPKLSLLEIQRHLEQPTLKVSLTNNVEISTSLFYISLFFVMLKYDSLVGQLTTWKSNSNLGKLMRRERFSLGWFLRLHRFSWKRRAFVNSVRDQCPQCCGWEGPAQPRGHWHDERRESPGWRKPRRQSPTSSTISAWSRQAGGAAQAAGSHQVRLAPDPTRAGNL